MAQWPDISKATAATGGGGKDAAVIVGIENYMVVSKVPGASQNANDWYEYFVRSRKIPLERVQLLRDNQATLEQIEIALAKAADRVKKGGTLWFVFIGHGAPAKSGDDGVLVGVDAQQTALSLYARSLPQKMVSKILVDGKQAQTVVLVDACFSGRSGSGQALAPGLQPLIVAAPKVHKRLTVLSAGGSDQFAGPLPGAKRPAFSYLVLGAMRGWGDMDKDGTVTVAEAITYSRNTMRATIQGRNQTPTVQGDLAIKLAKGAAEAGPDLIAIVKGGGSQPVVQAQPTHQPSTPPTTIYSPPPTVQLGQPVPVQPVHSAPPAVTAPAPTALPPGYNGRTSRVRGDQGWALGGGVTGFIGAGLTLILGSGGMVFYSAEGLSPDCFEGVCSTLQANTAAGLFGVAGIATAVTGPIAYASSRSGMASGSKGLRVTGWIGYGVGLFGLGLSAIGVANGMPIDLALGLGGIGTGASVLGVTMFSIDAILVHKRSKRTAEADIDYTPEGLVFGPTVNPIPGGGILGVGGSF